MFLHDRPTGASHPNSAPSTRSPFTDRVPPQPVLNKMEEVTINTKGNQKSLANF